LTLRLLEADDLAAALPMEAAIDALEQAFRGSLPEAPQRTRVPIDGSDLLLMPATGAPGAGVKLVTINPQNPGRDLPLIHGAYVLFAPNTLATVGVVEGGALTGLRTAAVSGLATRHLAGADARRLVIFGAGTQAHTHLDAMRAGCPLEEVTVVSRTAARAGRLVERARALGLRASVGDPSSVAGADLVCTCTTSDEPVFDGGLLKPGAHVNAVGAYRPDARELDDETMGRAGIVAVETRAAALAEAGDVVMALDSGALTGAHDVAELAEVVAGTRARASQDDISVFKSVGVAFEDLVVARAAFDRITS
jgi:ornithine cyclodeaminase/alanine dehydrogenase-like protein (mu-crystallin family)